MTDTPDFVAIIRDAVAADPQNLGLRVDLIELLLEHQPEVAAVEIETLAHYGANPQTVAVLRARAAAALLRKRNASPGLVPGTDAAAPAPGAAPPADAAPAPGAAPGAPAAPPSYGAGL
ncbi:MAG: ATP-binding protein, partial [Microbacterium sp.]